jgi:hypothetical protein
MPLTRRYHPEIAPEEFAIFGMDFSTIIPPGVGIASVTASVLTNTVPPAGTTQLVVGAPSWSDRTVYATIGAANTAGGEDFQINWFVIDTNGNQWPRTALLLCAPTS